MSQQETYQYLDKRNESQMIFTNKIKNTNIRITYDTMREYLEYLCMMKNNKIQHINPPLNIGIIWQCHMLDHYAYVTDMYDLFGEIFNGHITNNKTKIKIHELSNKDKKCIKNMMSNILNEENEQIINASKLSQWQADYLNNIINVIKANKRNINVNIYGTNIEEKINPLNIISVKEFKTSIETEIDTISTKLIVKFKNQNNETLEFKLSNIKYNDENFLIIAIHKINNYDYIDNCIMSQDMFDFKHKIINKPYHKNRLTFTDPKQNNWNVFDHMIYCLEHASENVCIRHQLKTMTIFDAICGGIESKSKSYKIIDCFNDTKYLYEMDTSYILLLIVFDRKNGFPNMYSLKEYMNLDDFLNDGGETAGDKEYYNMIQLTGWQKINLYYRPSNNSNKYSQ